MIIHDPSRQLPAEWVDSEIRELVEHANELRQNGNPAGYFLTVSLLPFISEVDGDIVELKYSSDWDYEGLRKWIAENSDQVKTVWQFRVRSTP